MIQKEDVWETKSWFRNEVSRIILENNLQTNSMEELEVLVIHNVKQMIEEVLPKPGFVDGPWKIYAERLTRSAKAEPISQEAFEHIRAEIMRVSEVEFTAE